jgi:hypothetical protein
VPDQGLKSKIDEFISAQKTISGKIRWRRKNHQDYVEAKLIVQPSVGAIESGTLIMTCNTYFRPPKYGFVMLYRNTRILALDVEPGRTHTNRFDISSKTVVSTTHWHVWPLMLARPDHRDLPHKVWLYQFAKTANILIQSIYTAPSTREEQRELDV